MNNEAGVRRILLVSGLIALPIVSVLLDIVLQGLQVSVTSGAGVAPLLALLFPIFALVVVLAALALDRYLASGSRGMAAAYAIVGLLIIFATALMFFLPVPEQMYSLIPYFQPGTSLFLTGAVFAGSGLLNLRKARGERPHAEEQ